MLLYIMLVFFKHDLCVVINYIKHFYFILLSSVIDTAYLFRIIALHYVQHFLKDQFYKCFLFFQFHVQNVFVQERAIRSLDT